MARLSTTDIILSVRNYLRFGFIFLIKMCFFAFFVSFTKKVQLNLSRGRLVKMMDFGF